MSSIFLRKLPFNRIKDFHLCNVLVRNNVNYVQGQSPEFRVREYFYYIDHQGMLFLDDARIKNFTSCFKDKRFLAFFFKRLQINDTGRYTKEFPYVSRCGRERNFVRCDDLPIVFTKVILKSQPHIKNDWFSYAYGEDTLTVPFEPQKIFMDMKSGRIYHPAPEKIGGIGLVSSKVAMEFSTQFRFEDGEINGPTHFTWRNRNYELDTEWYRDKIVKLTSTYLHKK